MDKSKREVMLPNIRSRYRFAITDLEGPVLDRIMRICFENLSRYESPTNILLVSKAFRDCGYRCLGKDLDLRQASVARCFKYISHVDSSISLRVSNYYQSLHEVQPSHLYPLTLHNFVIPDTRFRVFVKTVHISAKWDLGSSLAPSFSLSNNSKGFPLVALPVVLDVIRRTHHNLECLSISGPKGMLHSINQPPLGQILEDIVDRISLFGSINCLLLDLWELPEQHMQKILYSCRNLKTFSVQRHPFFTPSRTLSISSSFPLQSLTLSTITLELLGLARILTSLPSLKNLQLLGVKILPASWLDITKYIEMTISPPKEPSLIPVPTVSPIKTLVLRLSYANHVSNGDVGYYIDYEQIILILILKSLPTLEALHLSKHYFTGTIIVAMLCKSIVPNLRRLWFGFMLSTDEVGNAARLNAGDDLRVRDGLVRGDDKLRGKDPLPKSQRGSNKLIPLRRILPDVSTMGTERVVVYRSGIDELFLERLIDSSIETLWPPDEVYVCFERLFEILTRLGGARWMRELKTVQMEEVWVFETEYVSCLERYKRMLRSQRRDPKKAWELLMTGRNGRPV